MLYHSSRALPHGAGMEEPDEEHLACISAGSPAYPHSSPSMDHLVGPDRYTRALCVGKRHRVLGSLQQDCQYQRCGN